MHSQKVVTGQTALIHFGHAPSGAAPGLRPQRNVLGSSSAGLDPYPPAATRIGVALLNCGQDSRDVSHIGPAGGLRTIPDHSHIRLADSTGMRLTPPLPTSRSLQGSVAIKAPQMGRSRFDEFLGLDDLNGLDACSESDDAYGDDTLLPELGRLMRPPKKVCIDGTTQCASDAARFGSDFLGSNVGIFPQYSCAD